MKVLKKGNKLVAVRCEKDVNTADGCGMNKNIKVGDSLGSINIKTGRFEGNTHAMSFLNEELGLFKYRKVEDAKKVLKEAGYAVESVWSVNDVKPLFEEEISDEGAQYIVNKALENEATMEQIWLAIKMTGEANGFTLKEG